jgi:Animal haem peroxidase
MKFVHRHRALSARRVTVACCALAVSACAAFGGVAYGADSTASASAASASSNAVPSGGGFPAFEVRSLSGQGNNLIHPNEGAAGQNYTRVAPAAYADGISTQRSGSTAPNARYVSNRVFNDVGQDIFSERNLSQWGWAWGQFIDHTLGLAKGGTEDDNISTRNNDPLETFRDDFGAISMTRDAAAPNTGTSKTNPRQQVNTTNTFISAWQVYGGTNDRLEWLRDGPVDGNLANNAATLMLPGGYLPKENARGNVAAAPQMTLDGFLTGNPAGAAVAGDVRANENAGLTAIQTLFAREHNRIVGLLPNSLTNEQKFQIARRVVGAEEEFVTYNEFLPAMGVSIPAYRGYNPTVDPTETTEFATVGYRAHSQIHGEVEMDRAVGYYSQARLDEMEQKGIEVVNDGTTVALTVPLNLMFFDPDIVQLVGEGPLLDGLGDEPEYNNDEQIDNTLRSVLFRVPSPTTADPSQCFGDPLEADAAGCFQGIQDLGAIDLQRGRDHGIPTYNDLRKAYGLAPKTSFTAITGESSDALPAGSTINTPSILDFVSLKDLNGNPVPVGTQNGAVQGTRRSTLASRLKAIYGSVDNVDAFVGAYAEPHVKGSEMGQLNNAIWSKQFAATRDGDRFFYLNDPVLLLIQARYGITYKHTLEQIINANSDAGVNVGANVFIAGQS